MERIRISIVKKQINKAKKLICDSRTKIVSFDIFDTLLIRPCILPEDIYSIHDEYTKKVTNQSFIQLRRDAFYNVATSFPNINEIWEAIGRKHGWNSSTINQFIKLEMQIEFDTLYVRKAIKDLFDLAKYNNKRIILISDMYLESTFLKKVLIKNGIVGFENLYVSCECKCGKSDASIYKYVIKKERISPKAMVHIGDSFSLDYKSPKRLSINSIYIPRNTLLFSWSYGHDSINVFKNCTYGQRIIYGFAINSIFNNTDYENWGKWTQKEFAYIFLFPLITALSLYILNDKTINQKYNSVSFVSRDGYLPLKAFDVLKRYYNSSVDGCYLYASRYAYESLNYNSFFEYMKSLTDYNLKISDFLGFVIIDDKVRNSIVIQLKDNDIIINNDSLSQVKNILSKWYNVIQEHFCKKREICKQYYNNNLSFKNYRALVFDCGYNGSVAKSLSLAFDKKIYIDKIYLLQTNTNINNDHTFNTETYVMFNEGASERIKILCETMLSSLEGTCKGFEFVDNLIKPVLNDTIVPPKTITEVQEIQKQSINCTESFAMLFNSFLPFISIDNLQVFSDLFELFLHKNIKKSRIFKNIYFVDDYLNKKCRCLENAVLSNNYTKIKIYKIIKMWLRLD